MGSGSSAGSVFFGAMVTVLGMVPRLTGDAAAGGAGQIPSARGGLLPAEMATTMSANVV